MTRELGAVMPWPVEAGISDGCWARTAKMGLIAGRISAWSVASLFILGLYFPTSIDGRISTELLVSAGGVLGAGLLLLMGCCGLAGPLQFSTAVCVFVIIAIATVFSPFTDIAYGALLPMSLLTTLLAIHLRHVPPAPVIRRAFVLANAVNLIVVALLVAEQPDVSRFLIDNYSIYYPELVSSMLAVGKPVLTFGTHSLAGFFFYIFFFLCFRTYVATGSRAYYVLSFTYILILIVVNSFSSYMFAAIGAAQLLLRFDRRRPLLVLIPIVILASATILLSWTGSTFLRDELGSIAEVLALDTNGLRGRYSGQGGLTTTLRYIMSAPLSPVGIGYSPELMYGDSGPVEYMLRGSVPLVIAIYSGLYFFLRRNMFSQTQSLLLFGIFLIFEIGFSNLLYFRTQFCMPFIVVYMNLLERKDVLRA